MELILALEAGGTRTSAALFDAATMACLHKGEAGPANPTVYGVRASLNTLMDAARKVAADRPVKTAVAGVSGLGPQNMPSFAAGLRNGLKADRLLLCDDLCAIVLANSPDAPAMVVTAGTGASMMARGADGIWHLNGGRGPELGDHGSACRLAWDALRAAIDGRDGAGPSTQLTNALVGATGSPNTHYLTRWVRQAQHRDIAALAPIVAQVAEDGDAVAMALIRHHATILAKQVSCAAQSAQLPSGAPVYLNGSMLSRCAVLREHFLTELSTIAPDLIPTDPPLSGPRAFAELARLTIRDGMRIYELDECESGARSATEATHPLIPDLDLLDTQSLVQALGHTNGEACAAVDHAHEAICKVVVCAGEAIRSGGRLLYVGAGTSGRLGVLDASECPPTFGTSPEQVVGIIAGGEAALRNSVEGAEDDREQAVRDLPTLSDNDLVVGIAASGTTPYVRAALEEAHRRGARTALLCCNPNCQDGADIVIALDTGPEALPGSTRLKAGTATKMVLNMISTGAMALAGYIYKGRMVGMKPMNDKLRRRARDIVVSVTGCSDDEARRLLEQSDYDIRLAVIMKECKCEIIEAKTRLCAAKGGLRDALG